MLKWPGSSFSALLTVLAAYVVLFADFHFWGMPDWLQMVALLIGTFIPALGAAYGIFFFQWLFESERVAPYPDYSFGIWVISSLVSIVYMGVFAGFAALIPYGLAQLPWLSPDQYGVYPALIVGEIKVIASEMMRSLDYFEPFLWRSIGMFVVLEIFACSYGKRLGMRSYRPREQAE